MLPVRNSRHHHSLRSPVAAELVSNDHPWTSLTGCPQEPAEEADGREAIPLRLDENVKNDTILIDGPPEVVSDAVDLEKTSSRCHLSPVRARRLLRPSENWRPNLSHQHRIVS